jgi:hypothetical protein
MTLLAPTERDRIELAQRLPDPASLELISADEGEVMLAAMTGRELVLRCRVLQERLGALKLAEGGHRRAYREPGSSAVFKLPQPAEWMTSVCEDGIEMLVEATMANFLEVAYYEQDAYCGLQVAPCRIVWERTGIPVVIMEYLTRPSDQAMPAWAEHADGGQAGWSELLGSWAAYDAGIPPRNSEDWEQLGFEEALRLHYAQLVGELPAALAACLPAL